MTKPGKSSRREFISYSAAAAMAGLGFPAIVPASALGKNGKVSPANRVTVGFIGLGWQGGSNLKSFLEDENAQVLAVCDIDADHLQKAKQTVDAKNGDNSCAAYHYYEELIARPDIDAVCLSLPDHWHAIPAIAAAKAGKDIFGEKPLAHNWAEGRAICDAVKRYGRVWQTGSWQRSIANFRFAAELVLNGRIGKVHTVQVIRILPALQDRRSRCLRLKHWITTAGSARRLTPPTVSPGFTRTGDGTWITGAAS